LTTATTPTTGEREELVGEELVGEGVTWEKKKWPRVGGGRGGVPNDMKRKRSMRAINVCVRGGEMEQEGCARM